MSKKNKAIAAEDDKQGLCDWCAEHVLCWERIDGGWGKRKDHTGKVVSEVFDPIGDDFDYAIFVTHATAKGLLQIDETLPGNREDVIRLAKARWTEA